MYYLKKKKKQKSNNECKLVKISAAVVHPSIILMKSCGHQGVNCCMELFIPHTKYIAVTLVC